MTLNIDTLEKENEQIRRELATSQEQFEEINRDLAQIRQTKLHHTQRQTLLRSTTHKTQHPKKQNPQKTFCHYEKFKKSYKNSRTSLARRSDPGTNNPRPRGLIMLEKDFLQHGRKYWNTKTVKQFLKYYNTPSSTPSPPATQATLDEVLNLQTELQIQINSFNAVKNQINQISQI